MTRLTLEQLERANYLNGLPSILDTGEILELVALYNWDKFGVDEIKRSTGKNLNSVEELTAFLVSESITQQNFSLMMQHFQQARHWFSIFEAERQYENQFTDLIENNSQPDTNAL